MLHGISYVGFFLFSVWCEVQPFLRIIVNKLVVNLPIYQSTLDAWTSVCLIVPAVLSVFSGNLSLLVCCKFLALILLIGSRSFRAAAPSIWKFGAHFPTRSVLAVDLIHSVHSGGT